MKVTKVSIVDMEGDKKLVVDRMLAVYIGESCRYCNHVYESVEDIRQRKVVFAGPYMLACKACFDAENPANNASTRTSGDAPASEESSPL